MTPFKPHEVCYYKNDKKKVRKWLLGIAGTVLLGAASAIYTTAQKNDTIAQHGKDIADLTAQLNDTTKRLEDKVDKQNDKLNNIAVDIGVIKRTLQIGEQQPKNGTAIAKDNSTDR